MAVIIFDGASLCVHPECGRALHLVVQEKGDFLLPSRSRGEHPLPRHSLRLPEHPGEPCAGVVPVVVLQGGRANRARVASRPSDYARQTYVHADQAKQT